MIDAATKKMIEERAEKVLISFPFCKNENGNIDSVHLARCLGFDVELANLLEHEDGNINVSISEEDSDEPTEKYIVVNLNRSVETQRFTIMHELSYYLLYYTGQRVFMHRENERSKRMEESDANYMADCLLMPTKSFNKEYERLRKIFLTDEVINKLQSRFRVPRESTLRRIDSICQN